MVTKHKTYADATDFPKLYSKVYWGWFEYVVNPPDQDTLDARNYFAIRFDLQKNISQRPLGYPWGLPNIWDHVEVYQARDGKVLIAVSPYAREAAALEEAGLVKCERAIYGAGTNTWYRVFDDKRAYRKWAKGVTASCCG